MTNVTLAQSYLRKAVDRLDILDVLQRKGAYSDVVREAQEIVELASKGMLRAVGIEPPKFHDVGGLIQEHKDKFPEEVSSRVDEIAAISKRLKRKGSSPSTGISTSSPRRSTGQKMQRRPWETPIL